MYTTALAGSGGETNTNNSIPGATLPHDSGQLEDKPNKRTEFIINRLIHAASNDFEFVKNTLADLADIDEFWSKLVKVWLDSIDSEKEPFSLGLHRSDYLIETQGIIITLIPL